MLVHSDWYFKRERARLQHLEDLGRKSASTSELEHALSACGYFDLTVRGRSLRDTAAVKEFFRRLDAGEHRELLADFNTVLIGFDDAERSIGYGSRPMLLDYMDYLQATLEELASRSAPRG